MQQPALWTRVLQHTLRLLILLHTLHLMWKVGSLGESPAGPLKQPPKQTQLIPSTAGASWHNKQAPPSSPKFYTLQQVISLKILQGWTLKISNAIPDLISPLCLFFLTPQHWTKLAGFICRQIDQEILEMEELLLLYSGCITGSLCPKQLAGVPRKGLACCWLHKDVYLHSNLHEAEAILKASAVTFCTAIPIQKQIRHIAE